MCYLLILFFIVTTCFLSFMGGGQLPLSLPDINGDSSGNAVTSIPLEIPEGTKGLTPELSFSYHSGSGNGLLGRGWALSGAGYIKRDLGYGINYNSTDRFLSSDYGQLVDSLGNRSVYYTEEESYVSFYPQGDAGQGPTGFIAYDTEGTRYTFGGVNAQLTHPNGAVRIWGLAEVKEAHGETIQYEWIVNQGELYPSKITYAGGKRYIQFEYEGRSDAYPEYSEKAYTLKNWRLSRVKFYSDDSLVHSYILSYGSEPGTGDSLLTKVEFKKDSLLSLSTHLPLEFSYTPRHSGIMTKLNAGGATPLSNGYGSEIDMEDRGYQLIKQIIFAVITMKATQPSKNQAREDKFKNKMTPSFYPKAAGGSSDGFDFNALNVDVNRYNPDTQYIARYPIGNKNRDMCNWGPLACICTVFPMCPPAVRIKCGEYTFFGMDSCNNGVLSPSRSNFATDINGDGISEFSRMLGKMDGDQIYIRTNDFITGASFDSPRFPIKYNTYSDTADIDGDGKTDFLYERSGVLHVAYSNGSGLDNPIAYPQVLLTQSSQNYTRTSNYSPTDYAVDINRDGRADFVHFYDNRMSIYLSVGRGFQSERVIWYGGNRSPVQETMDTNPFIAHRMNQFSDIDGDGIPEHLHILNVNPPPEQSQLSAVKTRHDQELAAADAERQAYKDQVNNVLSGWQTATNDLAMKLHPDQRGLYWDLAGRPGEATQEQRDELAKSVDRQFSEDKMKEITERQANELDQEIDRIKSANLDSSIYHLIVTKLILAENRMEQFAIALPRDAVGAGGKNWLVDVNKDGLPDLLSLTNRNSHFNPYDYGTEDPYTFTNQVKVIMNTGGNFDTGNVIVSGLSTVIKPDRFAEKNDPYMEKAQSFDFTDIDENGTLDFVVKEMGNLSYHVYYGQGNGQFSGRFDFAVESEEIVASRFEDRNEDGIPDFFYQYGKNAVTRQLVLDSPAVTGGLLKRVINGVNGAEAVLNYNWKKSVSGAVLKGTGSYSTSLPNQAPQMLFTSVSNTKGAGLPIESTDYSYSNSRYKPGDLDTSINYGFESVTERNYINGGFVGRTVTSFIQNSTFPGMVASKESYAGNDSLVEREAYAYTNYTPHGGTKLKLPTTVTTMVYENGQVKDQKTQSITYQSAFAYEPSVVEETWNGRVTRKEMSYQANGSLQILAQAIENKIYIDGGLVEHTKQTYQAADLATQSKLVGNGEWYTSIYTYDGIGNVSSVTDSLGRTLSYEYGDLTRSKPTVVRNALGQSTTTVFDPQTDLEISVEDSNGNKVESEYDAYDRKTKTIINGNTLESYDYSFDGSLITLTKTTHTDEGDVWVKEIKDLFDQTIKTESLAVDGYTFTEEIRYDNKGREIQKSNRYLTGDSPVWTLTSYYPVNEDTSERPKQIISYTGEVSEFTYGLRKTTANTSYQSEIIRSEEVTTDDFGQLATKSMQGETLSYVYNSQGKLIRITDPGSGITTIQYDIGGRKTSQTDSNSGTTTYTYNVAGELLTQVDARGITHRYETDHLGRVTKLIAGSENPILFEYDRSNSIATSNIIGRLSKVTDETGITEFAYDRKGNIIAEKRILDDLQVIFQRTYDAFDRIKTTKYPEGTLVRNHYTGTGQLGFLTMDSHDGNSLNHTVVSYEGPKRDGNGYYIERKTGNGILTKIEFDPLRGRPLSYQTRLKDNTLEQSVNMSYDAKGNIASIQDQMNESRNQSFEYDNLNRVTKAMGKYGEEGYTYQRNGNLTKKGAFTYSYDNPNHIHAVTKVNSANTGILSYSYDEIGNMIQRNGDTYRYNAQGKLAEVVSSGGDRFEYKYDFAGNRIKKTLLNLGTVTYSFGNSYEIYRSPGQPEKHTMFVIGAQGDLAAQYSRSDANLIQSLASTDWMVNPFCKDVTIDCTKYWENRIGFNFITILADTNVYVNGKLKEGHRGIPWLLLTMALFVYVYKTKEGHLPEVKDSFERKAISEAFGISFLPTTSIFFQKQLPRYVTSLLVVIFSFTSTVGCFPLLLGGGEGETGTPIWLLGMTGVPATTQSVADENSGSGGSGGSGSAGNARVDGMYFYHPDHLGSVTMITDGNGNVLAGGERGGKSHITYKPYGEILRTDSYGPDITKFKYTGQEEDKETGLYYYKARYYDASLGRFLTNDNMIFPGQTQGMNRSMYVEGNPVKYKDPSGNRISNSWMMAAVAYAMVKDDNSMGSLQKGAWIVSAYNAGRAKDINRRQGYQNWEISRGLDWYVDKTMGAVDKFTDFFKKYDPATWMYRSLRDGRFDGHKNDKRNKRRDYYLHSLAAILCPTATGSKNSAACSLIANSYFQKFADPGMESAKDNVIGQLLDRAFCNAGYSAVFSNTTTYIYTSIINLFFPSGSGSGISKTEPGNDCAIKPGGSAVTAAPPQG
ncbi:RHS repeat-associated core domain-containing protein [Leptospira sp. 'Mane']